MGTYVLEDRNKGWWKSKEKERKKNGEERCNLPEAEAPHEMVLIQPSQAPSTALITSLTAILIALAKELGTCKQLTLISLQVISLKECWRVHLLTAALDSLVTQPWLLPLPLWTQLQLWVMTEKVARVWFFFLTVKLVISFMARSYITNSTKKYFQVMNNSKSQQSGDSSHWHTTLWFP